MLKLVVATRNEGKFEEFLYGFSDLPITLLSLKSFPHVPKILEDGKTFSENAIKKAKTVFKKVGYPTLADDSGLCVDILSGKPGIYSSRYAKEGDDEANNKKLLEELKGIPFHDRKAQFVCALALVLDDNLFVVEAKVSGFILEHPKGEKGFGYDPLFYVPSYGLTFAEMEKELKMRVSHRAKAISKMKKIITELFPDLLSCSI